MFLQELESGLKGTTRGGYLRLIDSLNAQGKLDEDIFQAMAGKFIALRKEDETPFLVKDVLSLLKYFNNFSHSGLRAREVSAFLHQEINSILDLTPVEDITEDITLYLEVAALS